MRKRYVFILIVMALTYVSCIKKEIHADNEVLQDVEQILWDNKQYAVSDSLLETIDTTSLSRKDKMIWYLFKEHLLLEELGSNLTDSKLSMVIPYFEDMDALWYAGHGHFLQGKIDLWHNKIEESMFHFKQAEEYLLLCEHVPNRIMYNLYYQMATCSNVEYIKSVTYEYCEKMIPYAQRDSNYRALSVAYKLMGNVLSGLSALPNESIPKQDIINLYDSSLYYFRKLENYKYPEDIYNIMYNRATVIDDTVTMYHCSKLLVDSFQFLPNAVPLIRHYVRNNQYDSARIYVDIFAPDTLANMRNRNWSIKYYTYYNAVCLEAEKQYKESSKIFHTLYDNLTHEVASTERARVHTVSQKYDVEKEQRRNLELKVDKLQLRILLIIIGSGAILLLFVFLIYRAKSKQKQERLEAENALHAQHIAALNKEVAMKRESMLQTLLQRIELTQKFQLECMKADNNGTIVTSQLPLWAQRFFEEQLLNSEDKSKLLKDEFNKIYYNMLVSLKADYPRLTKADLLMCVLITLHLSITDTCVLMSVPKQTVWNRRNRIKEHIGLSDTDMLEGFFDAYAFKMVEKEYARLVREERILKEISEQQNNNSITTQ